MQAQPLVVAVDRHHVAGLGQVEHQLQLLLPAVARGVDRRVRGGDHGRADLEDAVDRLVDRALVARDRRRREDHACRRSAARRRDARRGPSAAAPTAARPGCRSRSRSTRSSGKSSISFGGISSPSGADGDAEVRGDVEVLAHRAPDERDLAVERDGGVDHLLDAVHVGGEAGDHDPALAAREDLEQRRPDARLRRRDRRAGRRWSSRRTGSRTPSRPSSASRETSAGRPSTGRLVELVVAGDQDRPELGVQRDRARVGDRVRHVDHLELERARVDALARLSTSSGASRILCSSSFERTRPIVSGAAVDRRRACRSRAARTAARRRGPRGRA